MARKRKASLSRRKGLSSAPKKAKSVETSAVSWRRETLALVFLFSGVFLGVALYSYLASTGFEKNPLLQEGSSVPNLPGDNLMGPVGEQIASWLVMLLGWCSFATVIWSVLISRAVLSIDDNGKTELSFLNIFRGVVGSLMMAAATATIASIWFGYQGGGKIGSTFANLSIQYVNQFGTILLSIIALVLSFGIATGLRTTRVLSSSTGVLSYLKEIFLDAVHVAGLICVGSFKTVIYLGRFVGVSCLKFFSMIGRFFSFFSSEKESSEVTKKRRLSSDEPYVLGDAPEVESSEERDFRISRYKRKKLAIKKGKSLKKKKSSTTKISKPKIAGTVSHENYKLPPFTLLEAGGGEGGYVPPTDKELRANTATLERTLTDFKIAGKVVEVHPGPVITLYQFQPAAGVKAQKVISLADDLALSLKVASVRVYAPVPGQGTVGIEVPNTNREIVRLRDILETPHFTDYDSELTLAVGKNTFGDPYVTDLARMPHLLIAGATGSGKSVCINGILMSLLYRNTPETLSFIMIDPKMLELSVYEGIPHLKSPVVTNPKRARTVLLWAAEEMERRYALMRDMGVRNLASYNATVDVANSKIDAEQLKLPAPIDQDFLPEQEEAIEPGNTRIVKREKLERLPRIVIVVDELADLMLTVGREIEELLTRLAQKARAAGVHLILATQRPSVNVVTGLIKANFPARMSFQVASRIDARTVMDTSGAEKLLGQGDMLFMPPGTGRVKRLHSAFVTDNEVQKVIAWVKEQGQPNYDPLIEEMAKKLEESEGSSGQGPGGEQEYDALYDQAVALVIDKGQASTSMVQRVFRIGYNRAARILETMEQEGVVGPADGAKPRQVLGGGGANFRDVI